MSARRAAAVLLSILAGCGPKPAPRDALQAPEAKALAALACECPVALAAGEGFAPLLCELVAPFLGQRFGEPLDEGQAGFALGWCKAGLLGLVPAAMAAVLDGPSVGARLPVGHGRCAWAEGEGAAQRAQRLAGRFADPGRDPGLARVLPELLAASPWRPGSAGLWLGFAGLMEGRLPALAGEALGLGGRFAGRSPAEAGLLEVLNLEALEAAVLLLDPDLGLRGGIYFWPDRVGLPGLLLEAEEGLASGLPPGRKGLLWRAAPARLENLLEGLRGVLGGAAGGFLRGRIELIHALARGWDGTLFLEPAAGGVLAGVRLAAGPEGERLAALAVAAGAAAPGAGPRVSVHGRDLWFRSRTDAGEPFPLPGGRPGAALLAEIRWTVPAGREVVLEARLERASWGLEVAGRLHSR